MRDRPWCRQAERDQSLRGTVIRLAREWRGTSSRKGLFDVLWCEHIRERGRPTPLQEVGECTANNLRGGAAIVTHGNAPPQRPSRCDAVERYRKTRWAR